MATIDLNLENFESTISNSGIVLVDFWAAWCGPCRMFAPIFQEASERHPSITFGKVDTEDQMQLAGFFRIQSIPTLMVFRDGIGVFSQPGVLQGSQLDSLIEQVEKLDMAEIKQQIADQKTKSE